LSRITSKKYIEYFAGSSEFSSSDYLQPPEKADKHHVYATPPVIRCKELSANTENPNTSILALLSFDAAIVCEGFSENRQNQCMRVMTVICIEIRLQFEQIYNNKNYFNEKMFSS